MHCHGTRLVTACVKNLFSAHVAFILAFRQLAILLIVLGDVSSCVVYAEYFILLCIKMCLYVGIL